MHDLAEMGLRPCLAYGTLLGAYREKQFISHDDDVDILIEFADDNLTRGQAYAQRERLIEKLDPNKYFISTAKVEQNLNIHLFLKETNIMIDVFPYWHEEGKDSLHMEKMAVRSIPSQILAERTEIELAGKKFMAPGDIEGFLVERYGETWHVSDKYHEWLWPIETLQAENQES
jgi:phosphorylcholine metabolism protein LicD